MYMKVEVTYTKASAGFGGRETYGGRGGGKVKTETTMLVPIGEHVMEEGQQWKIIEGSVRICGRLPEILRWWYRRKAEGGI